MGHPVQTLLQTNLGVVSGPLVAGVLADGVVARVVDDAQLPHRLSADRSLNKIKFMIQKTSDNNTIGV